MNKLKRNFGLYVIILVSISPAIIWIFAPKANPVFFSFQNLIVSFGELFGLIGIVMFSLNLIIATRLHFIEKMFNGLNDAYNKHNLLGQTAFILLLFHPLLLLPKYASSLKEASSFLFIGNSLARDFGIVALAIMIILIILTLFLRPKYNFWKITHKFFGLALFLGALHVYLTPSYIMNDMTLKLYVLGFAFLGIISFIYKSILRNVFIKKIEYIVQDIKKLNPKIIEISLKPKNKKIRFNAGQFIFVSFSQKGISKEEHPFSISSSPDENILRITVKVLGDYTTMIYNKLQKGTVANINGPFGIFSYKNYGNKNQVWISGGIGITPFISFIRSIRDTTKYNIKLFYCVRNSNEAIYLNLLKQLEQISNNRFQVIPFYSEEKGRINKSYIISNTPSFKMCDFLLCAPPKMIRDLKEELESANIKKNKMHSEEFNF